jgi:hypothetical protein
VILPVAVAHADALQDRAIFCRERSHARFVQAGEDVVGAPFLFFFLKLLAAQAGGAAAFEPALDDTGIAAAGFDGFVVVAKLLREIEAQPFFA